MKFVTMLFLAAMAASEFQPRILEPSEDLDLTTRYERVQVMPVDDADKAPGFRAFREGLLQAVEAKDTQALLNRVHPNVKCSFGDCSSIEAFRQMWQLNESPEKSPLWAELNKILRTGGVLQEDSRDQPSFVAPYVFERFPDDRFEAHNHGVVAGSNVHVREGPGLEHPIIDKVSYLVVRVMPEADTVRQTIGDFSYAWRKIVLPDGETGYVYGKYLHEALGFRAGFQAFDGEWKMTFFVAGD